MATIQQQKIRIRLKAFDRRLLDTSCEKIVDTANRTGATAIGPIPLPTKRRIYCLLRSPHVDKDSREHFEIRIHKRILEINGHSNNKISEEKQHKKSSKLSITFLNPYNILLSHHNIS